jgi:hypothetical protein
MYPVPSSRRSKRRPWGEPHPELDVQRATGGRRSEAAPDGSWIVQSVAGSAKSYICPGCQQLVLPGTAHLVAWPEDGLFGREWAVAERRHWHTACWRARDRRRPR